MRHVAGDDRWRPAGRQPLSNRARDGVVELLEPAPGGRGLQGLDEDPAVHQLVAEVRGQVAGPLPRVPGTGAQGDAATGADDPAGLDGAALDRGWLSLPADDRDAAVGPAAHA